jgi:hypothetical protein
LDVIYGVVLVGKRTAYAGHTRAKFLSRVTELKYREARSREA